MGAGQIIKKVIKAGWDVPSWVGYQQIKQNAVLIKDLSKNTFNHSGKTSAPAKENFAQAMKRLNMTEEKLQKRIKSSSQMIVICGLLSIPMFFYTLYIFSHHFYLSGFVCSMLTCLLWAYTFREHFNRFQMRQRRLGCTFNEWAKGLFK